MRARALTRSRVCSAPLASLTLRRARDTGTRNLAETVSAMCYLTVMKNVGRRDFIGLLGVAAAWPHVARAQQPTQLIGLMSGRSPEDSKHLIAAIHEGLAETGFVEGKNITVEYRWALGQYDRLPAMAAELVKLHPSLLIAVGGDTSAAAAKKATATIPIVFGMGGDPVKAGLVTSFGRPGGNVTGYTLLTSDLEPKRLGLLRDLLPGATAF